MKPSSKAEPRGRCRSNPSIMHIQRRQKMQKAIMAVLSAAIVVWNEFRERGAGRQGRKSSNEENTKDK